MALTFYHAPQSRSDMTLWLLEEIGTPYSIHRVNLQTGAGKDAGFAAASPYGKVPAIKDGATAINETGAIALYLADKYAYGTWAPKIEDPRRGNYLRWILTCSAALDAALVTRMTNANVPAQAQAPLDAVLDFVGETIGAAPYVCGAEPTTPDVLLASALHWAGFMKAVPDKPVFKDYLARMTARPPWSRTQAINTKLMAA